MKTGIVVDQPSQWPSNDFVEFDVFHLQMLNSCRIFACHLRRVLRNASRTAPVATNLDVAIEMKRLNETEQYSRALDLFDEVQRREMPRDRAVIQALTACTRTRDLNRGISIHKKLSNRSAKNNYIEATLIHFYSQFNLSFLCPSLMCAISSAMRRCDQCCPCLCCIE